MSEPLLSLAEAMFELVVDNQRRAHGRQIEGDEGVNLLSANDHAFIYRPVLRVGI